MIQYTEARQKLLILENFMIFIMNQMPFGSALSQFHYIYIYIYI